MSDGLVANGDTAGTSVGIRLAASKDGSAGIESKTVPRPLIPAATAAGIIKNIGWHTFRRTTATLLLSTGASIRAAQELMRHASPVMTPGHVLARPSTLISGMRRILSSC
jgi:integrase